MKSFLVIQTAWIGDVILATPVIEKLHRFFPEARIDFLLRKGNEGLLESHPYIHTLYIWNKKEQKLKHLLQLSKTIRNQQYDAVININRFGSSGYVTWRSRAKQKIGFDKNPFSLTYTLKVKHEVGNGKHEVERNLELIQHFTDTSSEKPKLHIHRHHEEKIKGLKNTPYICMAPTSVWFTKQLPKEKWLELIGNLEKKYRIYLLGSANDKGFCYDLLEKSGSANVKNLCGELSFLESAALMKEAVMNYVNDSAPLHIASSVNAPCTAFFCSTIPGFGFGPLSDCSVIIETKENPECRPCGLHGFKSCPKSHFKCATTIEVPKTI